MKLCIVFLSIFLSLTSCHTARHIQQIEGNQTKVNKDNIKLNPEMDSLIAPYRVIYNQKMFDTLAYNPIELGKNKSMSNLGSWVTEGMKWYCDSVLKNPVDFSICNSGGIRVKTMAKGPVLLKNIYEIMPFDNALIILELDSSQMDSLTAHLVNYGAWPMSGNCQIKIDSNKKTGYWQVEKPISKPKFKIAISDFLANGGDKMYFMTKIDQIHTKSLFRDALIAYAQHQKTIRSLSINKISIIK